jgi:hypothetical protein
MRPLLFVVVLAGCLAPDSKPIVPEPFETFTAFARDVARWRELSLDEPLGLQYQTSEIAAGTTPAISLAQFETSYKILGLLPNSADLGAALLEYRRLIRLITYDEAKRLIIVNTEAARLGAPLAASHPAAARQLPAAIGVVRALQERRFHWRLKMLGLAYAEGRLALGAVAMGDALLAAVSRAMAEKPQPAQLLLLGEIGADVERRGPRLPDFLRERAALPYREGGQFVYWAFAARGWPGIDALYADPPHTTAQILHPETFFLRREAPLSFFPAALLRRLKGLSLIEDTLGELSCRALLENVLSTNRAAETAAGWRGDHLFAFQPAADIDLFWFSAWQDEAAAEKFLAAHRRVLENSKGLRFERVAQAKDLALIGTARDERAWLLQRRGNLVLAAHSVNAGRVTELAQDAWRDLEVDAEPNAVRFESARRSGNQFSLRSW